MCDVGTIYCFFLSPHPPQSVEEYMCSFSSYNICQISHVIFPITREFASPDTCHAICALRKIIHTHTRAHAYI